LHGFLDRSHEISQGLATAEGSFWHGIMHRREGDYPNAKYWFRQAGPHAIHRPLVEAIRERVSTELEVPGGREEPAWARWYSLEAWDPYGFVDLVERVQRAGSPGRPFCEKIAWLEWQLLFTHCYDEAFAPSA
jgi:hypothetical protein